jgi:undecaprenyl-diphosphatase
VSLIQAVILAALQGFTELFPFSSLGFQVIVPPLLHWPIDESSAQFLPFLVALHVGTAVGLIVYFGRDWARIIGAFLKSLDTQLRQVRTDPDQKTAWLLIAATIPAGLVGLAFQKPLGHLFAAPQLAAALLIVNGLIMAVGERLIRYQKEDIPRMGFGQAIAIGVAQVLALVPGFSRSGVTMVGGLAVGLSYETAARFSFLMATPVILAAGVLELHKLHAAHGLLADAAVGLVVAGLVAYLSVRYLMRYFRTQRLRPLAIVSITAGVVFSVLLALGV